ncbi:MAG: cytochrome c551/c552 [Glaciecola sp.]|jgi:cytochrome c551/c552
MRLKTINTILCALGFAVVSTGTFAAEITLPPDTSVLRESDLPGYSLAQQKCGICHSANYISYQPPGMTQDQWTAEMLKMQHSYGAPINKEDIKLIGAYLAVEYGSAKATDGSVLALTNAAQKLASQEASDTQIDVQTLLASNACMGCHAIDTKIVGPSFQEVAAKYVSTENAAALLAASIKQGGTGKWGVMAMPAMVGLSDVETRALADYVLEQ